MRRLSDTRFYTPSIELEQQDQETLILRSNMPLQPHIQNVSHWLKYWAKATPTHTFLAQRNNLAQKNNETGEWEFITYEKMYQQVQRVASALIDYGVNTNDKVIILSGNSINHAMLQLACTLVGITYIPLSPSYSLIPQARQKLDHIFSKMAPRMVFAESGTMYAESIDLLPENKTQLVTASDPIRGSLDFNKFKSHPLNHQLASFEDKVAADTVVKILMTSGSTGFPKGVPNTHRMICANQQSLVQVWPFLEKKPPLLIDWLPWHHTFGGNHNFYMIMRNGGTLYIDEGNPSPDKFQLSLKNLRGVSPTLYLNVPYGHENLVPVLEQDEAFSAHFFHNLQGIFTAASALSETTWQRWKTLCEKHDSEAFLSSAWGCTETTPLVTNVHFPALESNNIGLPLPGCELKLERHDHLYELCVRGPSTFQGYVGDTRHEYFDKDGYFHTGDLASFVDPDDIEKGLRFEGRLTENFKLASGNWVQVNALRVKVVGQSRGILQDVVITGENKQDIGLLMILNLSHCRKILNSPTANLQELASSKYIHSLLEQAIERHNQQYTAQTHHIRRVTFLTQPLSMANNEITDKGYINQRSVLKNYQNLVNQLHQCSSCSSVIWFK